MQSNINTDIEKMIGMRIRKDVRKQESPSDYDQRVEVAKRFNDALDILDRMKEEGGELARILQEAERITSSFDSTSFADVASEVRTLRQAIDSTNLQIIVEVGQLQVTVPRQ